MNKQIEIQKKAGKILSEVMVELMNFAKAEVTPLELDALATKIITQKGGYPGFKKVPGYHHATCISVNEVVVHGIPNDTKLQKGDIVSIDSGVFLDGYHTDITETIVIGEPTKTTEQLLSVGKKTMFKAIDKAVVGNRIGDISKVIQENIEAAGYSVIRGLIGHGVGKSLHEDPEIPGYVEVPRDKTPEIKEGMVLAVEAIYAKGKNDVYVEDDDWTIATLDKSPTSVFERTIVVQKEGKPEIITPLPGDEKYR